jgi:hypothetical protein
VFVWTLGSIASATQAIASATRMDPPLPPPLSSPVDAEQRRRKKSASQTDEEKQRRRRQKQQEQQERERQAQDTEQRLRQQIQDLQSQGNGSPAPAPSNGSNAQYASQPQRQYSEPPPQHAKSPPQRQYNQKPSGRSTGSPNTGRVQARPEGYSPSQAMDMPHVRHDDLEQTLATNGQGASGRSGRRPRAVSGGDGDWVGGREEKMAEGQSWARFDNVGSSGEGRGGGNGGGGRGVASGRQEGRGNGGNGGNGSGGSGIVGIRLQEPTEWAAKSFSAFASGEDGSNGSNGSNGSSRTNDGFHPGHKGSHAAQNHKSSGRVMAKGLVWDAEGKLKEDADEYGSYEESGLMEDAQFRRVAMRTTDEACQRQHACVTAGGGNDDQYDDPHSSSDGSGGGSRGGHSRRDGASADGLEAPVPSVPPKLGPMLPEGDRILKQLQV